jgi:hypothetical protein
MLAACSNNNQLGWYYMQRLPHQLDASASAYQLISYLEKTRALILENMEEEAASDFFKTALFIVAAGSNDIFWSIFRLRSLDERSLILHTFWTCWFPICHFIRRFCQFITTVVLCRLLLFAADLYFLSLD